jgi:N-glycosidase YbiA
MSKIESFQGEHRFLSNFWPVEVQLDGIAYPSVEHAYVASKTLDLVARRDIPNMAAGAAKRYGRKLRLRSDWNDVRLGVMAKLVLQKFQVPELAAKLRATGSTELVEGNTWGDTFWGVCDGVGQNNLGKILMAVRAEL